MGGSGYRLFNDLIQDGIPRTDHARGPLSIHRSLVFLDEVVALPAVLVWGRLADVYGFRLVSVVGHVIVGKSQNLNTLPH